MSIKNIVMTASGNSAPPEQYWVSSVSGNNTSGTTSVKVASSGNVYAAGLTYVTISSNTYSATLVTKRDPNGNLLWQRVIDNGANGTDGLGKSIALDSSENVYLCGVSYVVKLNTSGVFQWDYKSDNFGFEHIDVDGSGNVYAAGSCFDPYAACVLKFNSSGVLQWAKYSVTANVTNFLACDSSNGVYVGFFSNSSGQSAVLKLDAATGSIVWQRDYGAGAYSVITDGGTDSSNNVYITGRFNGESPYVFLAKYNNSGGLQWQRRWLGYSPSANDAGKRLAVSSSGDIYVIAPRVASYGSSTWVQTIVKYNTSGARQWTNTHTVFRNNYSITNTDIAVNAFGSLCLSIYTGDAGSEVLKVDSNNSLTGKFLSKNAYFNYVPTTSYTDEAATYADTTGSHSVFVLTPSGTAPALSCNPSSLSVSKNTISATPVTSYWYAYLDQTVDPEYDFGYDSLQKVAVDSAGNVYVSGRTFIVLDQFNTRGVALIAKYNSKGALQWQRKFQGGGTYTLNSAGIAIDSSGNVYISSFFYVVKYGADGTYQWQTSLGKLQADRLAVDGSGNIFVAGRWVDGGLNPAGFVKFNSSGVAQWVKTLGSGSGDIFYDVGVDSFGYVYVTGKVDDSPTVAKYNGSNGDLVWERLIHSSMSDLPGSISVTAAGDVYVAGYLYSANQPFLVKYDTSGVVQWQRKWGGSSPGQASVSVDSSGNAYVANGNSPSYYTTTIAKYNASGVVQWQRLLSSDDYPLTNNITAGPQGEFYITLRGVSSSVLKGTATIKLPGDGSYTGTYNCAGVDYVYASSAVAEEAAGLDDQPGYSAEATDTLGSGVTAGTSSTADLVPTLARIGG